MPAFRGGKDGSIWPVVIYTLSCVSLYVIIEQEYCIKRMELAYETIVSRKKIEDT